MVEVARNELEREEDGNSQQVEEIVDSGTGEGTFQLNSIGHLTHGNNGVSDRSTDVCSHNHVDTSVDDSCECLFNWGDNCK